MDNTAQTQQPLEGEIVKEPIVLIEDQEAEEEKQTKELIDKYNVTPKFARWAAYFADKEDKLGKGTFGNQTQSAMLAYSLDPEKQYFSAATIGKENFKKLQSVAGAYAEKQGLTFGKMLDIPMSKMTKSNNPEWYYIVAQLTGFPITPVKGNVSLTQNNLSISNATTPEQLAESKEEVEKFNKSFQKFLEAGEPE